MPPCDVRLWQPKKSSRCHCTCVSDGECLHSIGDAGSDDAWHAVLNAVQHFAVVTYVTGMPGTSYQGFVTPALAVKWSYRQQSITGRCFRVAGAHIYLHQQCNVSG